jgi:hypothetical protein
MGFVPQQKPINARGDAMSQIVSDIVYCENQIHQFFLNQKIGSLLKRSNLDKEKGISPVALFRVLVTLVFIGKNLFRTLEAGGSCGMAKDTVYRFLNSVHTNWRRFLLLLSSQVISQELEPLTVAPTERGVAGKASARQQMSLWRWWPRLLQAGSKPVTFCSTAGLPFP